MSSVVESDASSLEQKRALVARLLREKAGSRRDGTSLIHRRIEMQAERAPESVALKCAAESLTYSELNTRANRLARRLRAMGVGPEVLVGLLVGRSAEMVVGLLAILKAGGAYVPLDPAYPTERLAFMLEDARASVLLTEEKRLGELPECTARVVCVDTERASADAQTGARTSTANRPRRTSPMSSTPRDRPESPKGFQVTHDAASPTCLRLNARAPADQRS